MTWQHRAYDLVVIVVALIASYACALMAYDDVAIQGVGNFGRESGSIWKQVMPVLYGYGAFAAVMIVAVAVRLFFRRRGRGKGTEATKG